MGDPGLGHRREQDEEAAVFVRVPHVLGRRRRSRVNYLFIYFNGGVLWGLVGERGKSSIYTSAPRGDCAFIYLIYFNALLSRARVMFWRGAAVSVFWRCKVKIEDVPFKTLTENGGFGFSLHMETFRLNQNLTGGN